MLTRSCVVVEELTNDRLTNQELVAAAAAGDQSAWDALVDRYGSMLWSLTRSYRLGPADAADVVQTTWLRLVENLDRIVDPERLPGWLATTVRRECLRVSRRADVPRPGDDFAAIPDGGPEPGDRLLREERDAALWQALAKLGESCRRLLRVLLADPPPSYAEASVILGMKVGSIGPTRQRCLARLRQLAALDGSEP
ncbi:MAG: rpoE [Actinomycetia bacterium]|nr:rpoE [Actinomycetes bacterium]